MEHGKENMNNLFKLVGEKILTPNCFILYWFFWVNRNKELTLNYISDTIGCMSKPTVKKCSEVLKSLKLIKFHEHRNDSVFKVSVFKVKKETYNLGHTIKTDQKNLKTKYIDVNSKYFKLAYLLYKSHKKHDPKFLEGKNIKTNLNKWSESIRLLVEKNKRSVDLISEIIIWCQQPSNFWYPNILSGRSLRRNFDTMYAQFMNLKTKKNSLNAHKKIKRKKFVKTDVRGLLNDL